MKEAFLALPEEEMFKYFNIFKKALSGTVGKNLLTRDFPLHEEEHGGKQEFLMRLRASALKDDVLLEAFYDHIIESFYYVGNYLILLIHAVYDVPGKASDNMEMEDASDEVYEHILCCVCPVNLSKPGLSYDAVDNCFRNRIQDWIVDMPALAFLFPAFNDRTSDIHSVLYYSQNAEELDNGFMEHVLGCERPMSAGSQKETFQTLIEETLGNECEYEIVKNIHDKLNEMIEEKKDEPEPLVLDKTDVKHLFSLSGVEDEKLERFDDFYELSAGEDTKLVAANVANTRKFEIKTPNIVIQVSPDRADLVETKVINGRKCLVIELNDSVEVNGISVRMSHEEDDDL